MRSLQLNQMRLVNNHRTEQLVAAFDSTILDITWPCTAPFHYSHTYLRWRLEGLSASSSFESFESFSDQLIRHLCILSHHVLALLFQGAPRWPLLLNPPNASTPLFCGQFSCFGPQLCTFDRRASNTPNCTSKPPTLCFLGKERRASAEALAYAREHSSGPQA